MKRFNQVELFDVSTPFRILPARSFLPSIVQNPYEGGGGTRWAEIHKRMYRLPPELGPSDPGETLRPTPYHRDGLKVAALQCSSLGATNSSRGHGDRCPLYEFSVEFSLLFEPED